MTETAGMGTEEQETENWLNIKDRGGLYHVNDNTYHFFYQVELCLREFFNFRRIVSGDLPNCKETIIKLISRSEVLHTWHIMTDEEDNLLLVDEMYEVLIRVHHTNRVCFCNICGRVAQEVIWEKPAEKQGIAEDYS